MPSRRAVPRKLRTVTPDRLDLRDRPYQPDVTTPPPPSLNSLDDGAHPVRLSAMDQGETSACTGFALAQVVNYLLRRAGRDRDAPVSPYMLYSMARRYDEFPGYAADEGSSLRGALKGWYKHGACAERLWDAGLDLPPPQPVADADWWQDASLRPLGAYFRVDTKAITDMHVALHQVGVLYASAVCHAGWDAGFATKGRKACRIPFQKAAPRDGGHAFAIVGYDRFGFLVLNSWGPGWGWRGLGTLTYQDWLEHAMDCWVAQLGVVTEQHVAVSGAVTLRVEGKHVRLAEDRRLRDKELSPFIVDLENNGRLSNSGAFRTQPSDLEALLSIHLPEARRRWQLGPGEPVDVALYAHGGLTSEEDAGATAQAWIPALYEAQIFPIFLMWETDLWSTLKNRLSDLVSEWLAVDAKQRPTAGLRDQIERLWNRRLEKTLSVPGTAIWGEMKQNAEAIGTSPRSGVRQLYEYATRAGYSPGSSRVRLHLIGHSAGSIVHCHLVKTMSAKGWVFDSVTFLAPAATTRLFDETIWPRCGRGKPVRRLHQFHLSDAVEQRDPTCRPILGYGRSLLYLVSQSFEHGVPTPILGLEKDFAPYRKAGRAGVRVFAAPSSASESTTHGGFDDDPVTRARVIREIRKRPSTGRRGR